DHDNIDFAGPHIGQKPLEGGALERAAGEPAIVVAIAEQNPPLGPLACDIGPTRLPLGVQRVEVHVEAFLGGFAGVNSAAQLPSRSSEVAYGDLPKIRAITVGATLGVMTRRAHLRPCEALRPKKTQPFHLVPVISRATDDSDL